MTTVRVFPNIEQQSSDFLFSDVYALSAVAMLSFAQVALSQLRASSSFFFFFFFFFFLHLHVAL